MLNTLNLSDPPAMWDLWNEPQGERVTYVLTPMDYTLVRWVINAAWTTRKPTQLVGVVLFAESVALKIITQRTATHTNKGRVAA